MLKSIIKVYLLSLILYPVGAIAEEFTKDKGFDFRATKWGMTPDEVLKAEGTPAKKTSEEIIIFKTALSKRNAEIEYHFSNGKLAKAYYVIYEGYYAPQKHRNDYLMFDEILEKKYGKPSFHSNKWTGGESFKNDIDDATAIYFGYLTLNTKWDSGKNSIGHIMHKAGSDGGILHSISYSPKSSK
jgi:hypothetical protein